MKRIFLLAILISLISCTENEPPTCVITSPVIDAAYLPTEIIPISVDAEDTDGTINEVRILVNDIDVVSLEEEPYNYDFEAKEYTAGFYTIKAIAIDNNRAETSDDLQFKIGAIPVVLTGQTKTIGVDSAIVFVTITAGSSPMEAGIYWGTSTNPESTGTQVKFETVPGSFSMLIRNLDPGTKYYYKAFAENQFGLSYGDEMSFTTHVLNIPAVATASVSNIGYTSATSGGTVLDDGHGSISEKGVCWSASPNPTTDNFKTIDGSGPAAYNSQVTELNVSTTYYLRAYVRNEIGTGYGDEFMFISDDYTTPQLSTREISEITQTSVVTGGYITNNGGQEVTERGVCWSTSANPTIDDNILLDAEGGSGYFTSSITDLQSGTTYYLRAYATNSVGTGYGNEFSFSTIGSPSVTTTAPYNIGPTSATVGGNVTANGGAAVNRTGVFYGTTADPVSTGIKIILGDEMGEFSGNLTNLTTNHTYYVVAYAVNSYGTGYGEELEFIPE